MNADPLASQTQKKAKRAPLLRALERSLYIAFATALATLPWLATVGNAQTPAPLPEHIRSSILFMKSEENGTCGTGFVSDGGLVVTNAHVVRALCPTGKCKDVQLLQASGIGNRPLVPVATAQLHVEQTLPALDVAFLRADTGIDTSGIKVREEPPREGETAITLGYPKCGALTESRGNITDVESLRFASTTRGAHGSSGSPVFDENFQLIGIVAESASISGGLLSLVTDYRFETVSMRADKALSLRGLSSSASIAKQAELLLEYYRQHVRNLRGTQRMRAGVAFTAAFEGLQDQVLFAGEPTDAFYRFAFAGQHLDYLTQTLPPENSEASRSISTLVLAYNVEVNGAYQQPLVAVKMDQLFEAIRANKVPSAVVDDWREIISYAAESDFPGMELYGLFLAGLTSVVAVLVLSVLAWSMGYTFGTMPGSFAKRLLWMLANFVMWPIPPWLARRRKRSERRKDATAEF